MTDEFAILTYRTSCAWNWRNYAMGRHAYAADVEVYDAIHPPEDPPTDPGPPPPPPPPDGP